MVATEQADAGRSEMQSRRYNVTVQGRLSGRFDSAFPGVSVEPTPGQTHLVTEPFDQAQLHGLLNRVRDFGFDLISVEAIPPWTTAGKHR
jgi:hypothetical protein